MLRNLGVTTIVGVGVSVNIGMTNFAFDAVNRGYQMVMPRDAVAGVPADYAESVLDNTLNLVAILTTSAEVVAAVASREPNARRSSPSLASALCRCDGS